jgi:hypothetical protein
MSSKGWRHSCSVPIGHGSLNRLRSSLYRAIYVITTKFHEMVMVHFAMRYPVDKSWHYFFKGGKCELRMEDKMSGQLFAACPVDNYPGVAVEAVTDSSRYFVLCIQDSGRKAYIGIGFADRSDSFDLNVTLQDHFKQLKKENQFTKEATEPTRPNLDLAFKEGQTIRINIPSKTGELLILLVFTSDSIIAENFNVTV